MHASFYKKIERSFIFLLLSWLTLTLFFGERIPINHGMGWDGVLYTELAQHFSDLVFSHQLAQYSLQRILPSGVIYFFANLMHVAVTTEHMPLFFSIYNTLILVFAVAIWNKIATELNFNPQVRIISFVGLFFNYAILKMNTYYPILTDTSAFVCGLLMFYLFLKNKSLGVLATGVIGAFIFPTLLYVGLILFIFPAKNDEKNGRPDPVITTQNTIISIILAVILVTLSLFVCLVLQEKSVGGYYSAPIIYLSALLLFFYLVYLLRPFLNNRPSFFAELNKNFNFRLLIVFMTFVSVKWLIWFLSNGETGTLSFVDFFKHVATQSVAYPLNFLISHVIYYGLIVLLCMHFWKEITNYFKEKGPGLFIVGLLYALLSIGSESRQLINFFPVMVIVVADILNKKLLTWHFVVWFVALSLLLSKAWLTLNHGEWLSFASDATAEEKKLILQFPYQWYFMSQGPYFSYGIYLLNLAIVSVTFFITYKLFRKGITARV